MLNLSMKLALVLVLLSDGVDNSNGERWHSEKDQLSVAERGRVAARAVEDLHATPRHTEASPLKIKDCNDMT